jgi:hypothetical protein
MNTCASQHPADLTPLYESVHASTVFHSDVKRVLLSFLSWDFHSIRKPSA